MNTIHFEQCVAVRTISLYELHEEFDKFHNLEHRTKHLIKKAVERYLEFHLSEFKTTADTSNIDTTTFYKFQNWLTDKYDRKYCNRIMSAIRRIFKWGVLLKLVSSSTAYELSLVPRLQYGDRRCRENPPRTSVPDENVNPIFPQLREMYKKDGEMYADMLRLKQIHGMRPCETCGIERGKIDFAFDGENWLYQPDKHKTASRGKVRTFVFCKESQEILNKYLTNEPNQPVFRNRRGNAVSPSVFGKKIKKAIDRGKLPKFVLYQLRHNAATAIAKDKEFGKEGARALLGHADVKMTENYVHEDDGDIEIIQRIARKRNKAIEKPMPDPPESPDHYPNIIKIAPFLPKVAE